MDSRYMRWMIQRMNSFLILTHLQTNQAPHGLLLPEQGPSINLGRVFANKIRIIHAKTRGLLFLPGLMQRLIIGACSESRPSDFAWVKGFIDRWSIRWILRKLKFCHPPSSKKKKPLITPGEKGKKHMRHEDMSTEEPPTSEGSYENWSPQLPRHTLTPPRQNDGAGPSSAIVPQCSREGANPAPSVEPESFLQLLKWWDGMSWGRLLKADSLLRPDCKWFPISS